MSSIDSTTEIDFQELSGEVELNSPESFARALISYASDVRANDIFISDDASATSVKFRQMGRVREVRRLTRDYGRRLQNHYRALSAIDAVDLNRPSEGRTQFQLDDDRIVDLRVSMLPSLFGHDLAIRIAEQGAGVMRVDQLGMFDDEQHQVHRLLDSPSGLILVAGPTGSGKTHSLYSFLDYLNNGQRKIHTLEEPIERILPGIVQSQVTNRPGMNFHDLLAAVLRHSPDVIMIGEIRDNRTADIAVRAAASGQLVLATIHAQTAASAVDTMLAYEVQRHFLASTLVGVIAQRLVRRLCEKCKQKIQLPTKTCLLEETRSKLGITSVSLTRSRGCAGCADLGFDRLICIPEIMIGTAEIRAAAASARSTSEIEQIAVGSGMRTLRDAAKMRIAKGLATAEDIYQILPPQLS